MCSKAKGMHDESAWTSEWDPMEAMMEEVWKDEISYERRRLLSRAHHLIPDQTSIPPEAERAWFPTLRSVESMQVIVSRLSLGRYPSVLLR